MLISNSCAKKLITKLREAKEVHLVDEEGGYELVGNYDVEYIKMEQYARVYFEIPSKSYFNLFEDFKKEYTHNFHIIGFNEDLYYNLVRRNCESIKFFFDTIHINGIDVRIRNDAIFKHFKIGEVETHFDYEGEPYDVPKPIHLSSAPWKELKSEILTGISEYFTYQEKVINIIMNFLRTGHQKMRIPRYYGSTYPYNYFKFNIETIGDDEESQENINTFFKELIEKKYIDSGSLKSLHDFFSDNPSKSKIVWLKSKQELNYLISQLESRKLIIDTKREKSRLIAKVFIKKDGSRFNPEEFHNLHSPKYTKDLDCIIGILK